MVVVGMLIHRMFKYRLHVVMVMERVVVRRLFKLLQRRLLGKGRIKASLRGLKLSIQDWVIMRWTE